jgi:hypothetical protein
MKDKILKSEDKIKEKIPEITKEILLSEFKEIIDEYQKEYPKTKALISRKVYRKKTQYATSFEKFYSSFEDFRTDALGGEEKTQNFQTQRQLILLKDEISALKKERDHLLKGNID